MNGRKLFMISVVLSATLLVIFEGCKKSNSNSDDDKEECPPVTFESLPLDDDYIVIMNNSSETLRTVTINSVKEASVSVLSSHKIESSRMKTAFSGDVNGFVAKLSVDQAKELRTDSKVSIVEADRVIKLGDECFTLVSPRTAQWGVKRVGVGDGIGKTVWIIDTGVDLDHPDLDVDLTRSRSFVSGETDADDHNGHGTHVAGIIGALNNSTGVLGVASGAKIVALKVLNEEGEGNTSLLIQALNYVSQNAKAGDVVNMSLGMDTISNSLDNAVRTVANKGILFSIAAGNDSKPAANTSPARVNNANVFTISAIDSTGKFADFSNYGNDAVDYAAPGVSIISTWTNGRYARLNGTSMAAPHVAGLLLLKGTAINTKGFATNDPDGTPDPIASY